MLTSKEYVKKLRKECEPLFQFAENGVRQFFEEDKTKEELLEYFIPRMVGERGNCVGISKRIVNMPDNTRPEEMWMYAKQVYDEAKHFKLGLEIVEHINEGPVDLVAAINKIKERNLKADRALSPSQLMDKYESSTDPLAQAIYGFVGEGRAARNWSMIAKTAKDPFLSKRYEEIAKDEKFHASIGRKKLEELCTTQEIQDRADKLAREFIDDLYTMGLAKRYKVKTELAEANGCIKSHYPLSAM
jgi:rubrerythrin